MGFGVIKAVFCYGCYPCGLCKFLSGKRERIEMESALPQGSLKLLPNPMVYH